MRTLRTFVAVEIGGDIRSRAAWLVRQLRAAPAKVKWVEPQNLHWSMKFLGAVDPREIANVCSAVTRAAAGLPAFEVEAQGAGAFPDLIRPRTVWIGMGKGAEQMALLHDRIEAELAPLGFPSENRRFKPHLTLGRVRESGAGMTELAVLLEQHRDFSGGVMEVDELVVFSSTLGRDGPTYEPLATAGLLEG